MRRRSQWLLALHRFQTMVFDINDFNRLIENQIYLEDQTKNQKQQEEVA